MDLKEIVNRDLDLPLTQEESLFVLKEYVKVRKGQDINPVIIMDMPTPFIIRQLEIMASLTFYAIMWYRTNSDKII